MFRKLTGVLCFGALALGIPAFAQDEPAKTTWTCPEDVVALVQSLPESERVLNWYNWTTYEAETTRPDFGELCGVTVNEDNFGSNEELIAKLRQGNPGYDLVVPTGVVIPQMVREGLLEEIDISKIPNFANVSTHLQAPAYDTENKYSVPYQWGTIAIGYNTEAVGQEVTSWEDMWNFGGNVAWIEDPRSMLGIALTLQGMDPNSTDPAEIGAARDYLIDRGGNVRTIAQDDGQEKLLSGEADMVIEYSGDIFQIIADCEANPEQNCAGKFAYVIPSEGAIIWVDNLAIPTDAPHPELAHAFIDYILDPVVGADISNYTAYATPNQASIDEALILPEYLESTVIYPDEAASETLFTVVDLGDDVARLYNDAWTELRTLLGQ
ncbi:MAG: spermidine/putrescine ABC transporter substrate-binding protein [Chloroflexi bacterium]|nr:spermidine/putrescine ABC transporter substrate-binding protein [Chloroflexota bacterium]MCC6896130.1 spermidine/putrescine ABC transporter substrate-binding protein [Anaerolineae bacterium]